MCGCAIISAAAAAVGGFVQTSGAHEAEKPTKTGLQILGVTLFFLKVCLTSFLGFCLFAKDCLLTFKGRAAIISQTFCQREKKLCQRER